MPGHILPCQQKVAKYLHCMYIIITICGYLKYRDSIFTYRNIQLKPPLALCFGEMALICGNDGKLQT